MVPRASPRGVPVAWDGAGEVTWPPMERDGPKTAQELFKGTDPKAKCAGARKVDHEWWIVYRWESPLPELRLAWDRGRRYLRVMCAACGAVGTIEVTTHPAFWDQAEAAWDKPYHVPQPETPRVKNIGPRPKDLEELRYPSE